MLLGERVLLCDPSQYLVVSVDLSVSAASGDHPYLRLCLDLGPAMLGALIMEGRAGGRPRGGGAANVGYDSPPQFSREYRRLLGEPPMRDAVRLRSASGPVVGGLTRRLTRRAAVPAAGSPGR